MKRNLFVAKGVGILGVLGLAIVGLLTVAADGRAAGANAPVAVPAQAMAIPRR